MRTTISVTGLSEFNRALRRMDSQLPIALRLAMNEAADFLIQKARQDIPRRTGAAAASLKAKSTRTDVRIGVGGRRAPYYPWLDFGGAVGKNKSVKRPFIHEGRYLYPTLRVHRDRFTEIMRTALINVAEDAGVEVD